MIGNYPLIDYSIPIEVWAHICFFACQTGVWIILMVSVKGQDPEISQIRLKLGRWFFAVAGGGFLLGWALYFTPNMHRYISGSNPIALMFNNVLIGILGLILISLVIPGINHSLRTTLTKLLWFITVLTLVAFAITGAISKLG